jgi:restriction system protein
VFDDDIDDGLAYERLCAEILEASGWEAQLTPTTGDQGADIIASKDGTRLVVQCKFYTTSVGNQSVQEAFAAMRFQRAQHAAVVTNSTYTKSARQLASSTGVLLLHHDQLPTLDEMLGLTRSKDVEVGGP